MDPVRNFIKLELTNLPYSDSDTEFDVVEIPANFPDPATEGPFNLVVFDYRYRDPADDPNREIIRVTGLEGTILTVDREQENTTASAKTTGNTYKAIMAVTEKRFTDPIQIKEFVPTVNPPANHHTFYVDPADGLLKQKDDAGGVSGYAPSEKGTWTPAIKNAGGGLISVDSLSAEYIITGGKTEIWVEFRSTDNLNETNYYIIQDLPSVVGFTQQVGTAIANTNGSNVHQHSVFAVKAVGGDDLRVYVSPDYDFSIHDGFDVCASWINA